MSAEAVNLMRPTTTVNKVGLCSATIGALARNSGEKQRIREGRERLGTPKPRMRTPASPSMVTTWLRFSVRKESTATISTEI